MHRKGMATGYEVSNQYAYREKEWNIMMAKDNIYPNTQGEHKLQDTAQIKPKEQNES